MQRISIAMLCFAGLLACSLAGKYVFAADLVDPVRPAASSPKGAGADFKGEQASQAAHKVANWVVEVADNHNLPFIVVDKTEAKVFLFDAAGALRGAAPALLGLAKGDDSVPGIGTRKLSSIRPEERTTPAGRFVANLDRGLKGEDMLWVDYETAISLHPVVTSNARERRQERLTSPSPVDNRISFGCINVPARFFNAVVMPAFRATDGIVYILPDTKSLQAVFAASFAN
jgi:hypothetical protein